MKYIEELHIEGLKKFRQLDVTFNPQMNIIVGENEAGKSTILEAIKIVLNDTVVKLVWNNAKKYSFNAVNWSYSKGDTYKAVCIILTDRVADLQNENFDVSSITEITKNKLYVAITRTKGNLYFIKKEIFDKIKDLYWL